MFDDPTVTDLVMEKSLGDTECPRKCMNTVKVSEIHKDNQICDLTVLFRGHKYFLSLHDFWRTFWMNSAACSCSFQVCVGPHAALPPVEGTNFVKTCVLVYLSNK